jgi:peptidoglycan/LPS O-acetylase OafA/YrhL
MAVVMQHFSTTAQLHSRVPIPSLVPHGYLAVDFFFVLSGYIMCYTYLAAFQRLGWGAYGDFLRRRAIRLMPLNAAIALLLLGLGLCSSKLIGRNLFHGPANLPLDLISNLLMLQGLGVGKPISGPSWSVSVELLAYALFPLLIRSVFSPRRVWQAVALLTSISGLCVVARQTSHFDLAVESAPWGALRCITEFSLGMLAYRWSSYAGAGTGPVSSQCAGHLQPNRVGIQLGSDRSTAAALLICLLLVGLRQDLMVALSFPFVVAAVAHNSGRVATVLEHRWLHFLGVVSFSIYLVHDALRGAELELVRALHPVPLDKPWALLFAFLCSLSVIPVAWVTYRLIEHPSRVYLSRRFLAQRSSAAALATVKPTDRP